MEKNELQAVQCACGKERGRFHYLYFQEDGDVFATNSVMLFRLEQPDVQYPAPFIVDIDDINRWIDKDVVSVEFVPTDDGVVKMTVYSSARPAFDIDLKQPETKTLEMSTLYREAFARDATADAMSINPVYLDAAVKAHKKLKTTNPLVFTTHGETTPITFTIPDCALSGLIMPVKLSK